MFWRVGQRAFILLCLPFVVAELLLDESLIFMEDDGRSEGHLIPCGGGIRLRGVRPRSFLDSFGSLPICGFCLIADQEQGVGCKKCEIMVLDKEKHATRALKHLSV